MSNPCQSYVPGGICRDGFPFSSSSACNGNTCHSCGRPNDTVPPCQNEDLGQPWLNEDGSPRHVRRIEGDGE